MGKTKEKNDLNSLSKFSEWAFVAAPLTAISYGAAYLYKVGYFKYYFIPTFFIDLTFNSLTNAIMTIAPIIICFLILLFKVIHDNKKKKMESDNLIKVNIKRLIFQSVLVLIVNVFYFLCIYLYIKYIGYAALIFVAIGIIIAIFIFIIFWLYRKNRFKDLIFWTLIFFLISAYASGIGEAANKNYHVLIEQDNTTYVVLETYKEYYIVAPVDIKKKKIIPKYKLVEMKDKDITIKNTGTLTVKLK
jgi:hypothetical protein